MKRYIIVLAIVMLSSVGQLFAQVDFIKVSSNDQMEGVWERAAKENLNVFVDVYASWCGPCKWMDSNVFATEEAGNYLNKGFISVKMDGESEFGSLFAQNNGLEAYPTLFVFSGEKKMMNMLVGAKEWVELEESLQNTTEFFPILELHQTKYDSDLLDREDFPAYLKALRRMHKDEYAMSVVAKYKMDYMEDDALSATDIKVTAFYVDPGTDEWGKLTENIDMLKSALGDELEQFIDNAHEKSILISVEDYDLSVAQQFISILPKLVKGTELDLVEMETSSNIYFYHYTEEFDDLIAYVDNAFADSKKGDFEWLFQAAADAVFLDPGNLQMTEKGVEWFTMCINNKETYDSYFHLALSQYFSSMVEESIASLKRAGELARDEVESQTIIDILSEIEAMQEEN